MGSSAPASCRADPSPEPAPKSSDRPIVQGNTQSLENHSVPEPWRASLNKHPTIGDEDAEIIDEIEQEPSSKPTLAGEFHIASIVPNKTRQGEAIPLPVTRVLDEIVTNAESNRNVEEEKDKNSVPQSSAKEVTTIRSPVARVTPSVPSEPVAKPKKLAQSEATNDMPVVYSVEKVLEISPTVDTTRSAKSANRNKTIEQKVVVSGIGNIEVKPGSLDKDLSDEFEEKIAAYKKKKAQIQKAKSDTEKSKQPKKRRLSARAKRWERRSKRKEGDGVDDSDFFLSEDVTEDSEQTSEVTDPGSYTDSTNSFKRYKDLRAMVKENRAKHIPRKAEVKIWKFGRIVWAKIGKYGYWPAMVVPPDSYMWLKKDHGKRRPKGTVTVHFFADGCLADVKPQDVHDFDTNRHLQADEGEDEFASGIEAARIAADLILKKYGHSYPRRLDRVEEELVIDGSGIGPSRSGSVKDKGENEVEEKTAQVNNEEHGGGPNDEAELIALKAEIDRLKVKIKNEQEGKVKLQNTLDKIRGLAK